MNMDIILIVAISVSFVVSNKLIKRYEKKSMRNMDIPSEITQFTDTQSVRGWNHSEA